MSDLSKMRQLFDKSKFFGNKILSIELCPNKSVDGKLLQELSPTFCSVVWQNNLSNIDYPCKVSKIPAISVARSLTLQGNHVVMHLAGRYLNKVQALEILEQLKYINVRNIFVLQGEVSDHLKESADFQFASDFIKFIRKNYDDFFCIGVAAYAETHPLSKNKSEDLKYLKMKVNSGADFIITQMIFEPEIFEGFQKECKEIGINVPIIPGIYTITSYKSFISMTSFCKVKIPNHLMKILLNNRENPSAIENFGIFYCYKLIQRLFSNDNVVGVHFFCLNNLTFVTEVCKLLRFGETQIERPL